MGLYCDVLLHSYVWTWGGFPLLPVFLVLLQCICFLRLVFSYFGWDLSSCDVSLIVQIFISRIELRSVYCQLSGCPCFVLSNVESRFNHHN